MFLSDWGLLRCDAIWDDALPSLRAVFGLQLPTLHSLGTAGSCAFMLVCS